MVDRPELTDGNFFQGNVLEKAWNYVKPMFSDAKHSLDPRDDYDFNHKRRGVALIVCNEEFEGQTSRQGSKFDVDHFGKTFLHLGFSSRDIRVRYNMKAQDMLDWFTTVSLENHNDCDCLVVAITSHGDQYSHVDPQRSNVTLQEDVIYSSDKVILTRDLVDVFSDENCPSLINKPRIFLLQACRGQKLDQGIEIMENMDVVDAISEPEITVSPAPCYKDFCIVYATPPGHYAFRRPSEGSWFVKGLWDVIGNMNPAKIDFQKLMTRVICHVGFDYESSSNNRQIDRKKQIGCVYSMLTKDVYFTVKDEEEAELMS